MDHGVGPQSLDEAGEEGVVGAVPDMDLEPVSRKILEEIGALGQKGAP